MKKKKKTSHLFFVFFNRLFFSLSIRPSSSSRSSAPLAAAFLLPALFSVQPTGTRTLRGVTARAEQREKGEFPFSNRFCESWLTTGRLRSFDPEELGGGPKVDVE